MYDEEFDPARAERLIVSLRIENRQLKLGYEPRIAVGAGTAREVAEEVRRDPTAERQVPD